jgi:hypothetical protein
MSVEADFGISEWVFQATGTELSWEIAWNGVLDRARFAAVSFASDFGGVQLVRVSEWFTTELATVGERIRVNAPFDGAAFRFSVVVIPNH